MKKGRSITMEKKGIKIVLTEKELDQINGGIGVIRKIDGIPVEISCWATEGKDEPGKNKIFK